MDDRWLWKAIFDGIAIGVIAIILRLSLAFIFSDIQEIIIWLLCILVAKSIWLDEDKK